MGAQSTAVSTTPSLPSTQADRQSQKVRDQNLCRACFKGACCPRTSDRKELAPGPSLLTKKDG